MPTSSQQRESSLTPKIDALQHGPRPLPLFLALLREQTKEDPQRLQRALDGLRRYQQAERAAKPALMPVVASRGGASLRDYGGSGAPVLFVPSLINPPNILDLGERSLLRWLAGRGPRVLLLDWGWPQRGSMSIGGHVEETLVPLMEEVGEKVDLVGYCLGGTMAVAAAQMGPARSLATLAAPWLFSGFPDEARERLADLWDQSRPTVESLDLLPMEVLQSAFWSLDPTRTVAKFEAYASMDEDQARRFVALEDWANDGPPLAGAAARELFEDLFAADLPGRGEWKVGGVTVDPERLGVPVRNFVSTSDRIVPAATAMGTGERLDLDAGHVGMVVGSTAPSVLWERLADWLERAGR